MPSRKPSHSDDTFAERLGAAMLACGMTQRELAAAAGLSESAVSQYLSGAREPGLRVLAALCAALGVTPSALVPVAPAAASADADGSSDSSGGSGSCVVASHGAAPSAVLDAASLVSANAALLPVAERRSLVLALFDA